MTVSKNTPSLYFFLKLLPPRPSFNQDMNQEEKTLMEQHFIYWKELQNQGKVIVFGPVLDPGGVYGVAIVVVDTEEEMRGFAAKDPVVKSGLMHIEFHPMRAILP
ncbi:MAG: YciI family protein [Chitinophagaceae bacterium]